MKEFKYVITDEMGIHARPAGLLVKAVKGYDCTVKMEKGGRTVDCKGIMGVMSLAIARGTTVTLIAEGVDEEQALDSLATLVENEH